MTKERELLRKIFQQIDPERYYNHSDISHIILPDGRHLDEALRNDPAAPPPLSQEVMAARIRHFRWTSTTYREGKAILGYLRFRYDDNLTIDDRLEEASLSLAATKQAMSESKAVWRGRLASKQADYLNRSVEQKRQIAALQNEIGRLTGEIVNLTAAVAFDPDEIERRFATFRRSIQAFLTSTIVDLAEQASVPQVGIYLLLDENDRLLYVGQSTNLLPRLNQHRLNGKEFHRALILPLPLEYLNDVEGLLIRLIRPPLNSQQAPQTRFWDAAGGVISLEGFSDAFVPRYQEVDGIVAFVRSVANVRIPLANPNPEQTVASQNG